MVKKPYDKPWLSELHLKDSKKKRKHREKEIDINKPDKNRLNRNW